MEVISIDVSGKFAHFRKFYANNTALSYFIPPRTTIMGMLASLQGKKRDSYYNEMTADKIRIGVRILSPVKKTFHRVNLLSIKTVNDFRGKSGRTQIPFEVISGIDPVKDFVKYRIYVAHHKAGERQFKSLKNVLNSKKFTYNFTFGTANFSAFVDAVNLLNATEIDAPTTILKLHSAICSERLQEIKLDSENKLLIEEEQLPAEFVDDNNRELSKIFRVVYATNNNPIPVILKGSYFELSGLEQPENIVFIE